MGLFDKLFGGKTIDEDKYNALLSATKVGLAFLSGSDGGSLSLVNNGISIEYILLCRTTFFVYQNELGIGAEALLKKQGGNCPSAIWNMFVQSVDIRKLSERLGAEELDIRTRFPIRRNTAKLYFDKLTQQLATIYLGVQISNGDGNISIIVRGNDREKYTYR